MIDLTHHFASLASTLALAEICGSWVFLCSRMCSLPPALWEQVTRWERQPGGHLALVVSQSSAVLPAPWIFWALGKGPQ